jgi:type IV pilus assembly protein PilM
VLGGRKNLVGVDIGSSSIKLVELKQSKKGISLVHFRMVPLPPETIVDGAIMNSAAVVEALNELLAQEKVKTKEVATSVAGHSVIVKKIKLPQMSEQELEESIQWEAEQYIPFDINDVNMAVQPLGNDEQDVGQMEVLLVAAKKDLINDYTAVLSEAGLIPLIMDVDAFAIENMFEANYGIQEGQTIVLANIGASTINLNILRNGISTFTRDISMGGNQFTEEIQKQLNVSYEEAESLKLGGELGGPSDTTDAVIPQEVGGIIRSVSETLASELQRSLDFFSATAGDDRISKVFLSGGSAKVPGLPAVIEAKLGIPVEIADPFKNITIDEKNFNVAHIRDVAPAAAVAVGLGLRYLGDR